MSHFGCFSGHVLSKTKSVTPHFFYISDITNSLSYSGKSFRKKSMLKNFRANVLKRIQLEELQSSGIDCVLSEKDALIEEFCEREDSFSAKDKKKSDDKEAAEEIRKKAMKRMASKKKIK